MEIKNEILTVNKFSRPGTPLKKISGIVIHWTGNAGSTAMANRNYFENLKDQAGNGIFASAHFIVGLPGEVIQCIPENEIAYHAGAQIYTPLALNYLGTYPNNCTIGIEMCHPDESGKFNNETLSSCLILVGELREKYKLTKKDIYRHYDVTLKNCPRYFVENADEWFKFREAAG
jgi:N-acetylmuramoyl-L-alanine amidase